MQTPCHDRSKCVSGDVARPTQAYGGIQDSPGLRDCSDHCGRLSFSTMGTLPCSGSCLVRFVCNCGNLVQSVSVSSVPCVLLLAVASETGNANKLARLPALRIAPHPTVASLESWHSTRSAAPGQNRSLLLAGFLWRFATLSLAQFANRIAIRARGAAAGEKIQMSQCRRGQSWRSARVSWGSPRDD